LNFELEDKGMGEIEGIEDAALMMGTAPNKEMLFEAGLLAAEGGVAGPNDLIVAVRGEDGAIEAVKAQLEELLQAGKQAAGPGKLEEPHTLAEGVANMPDANLVLISTPGIYAAAEARKALTHGRHVMVFSDNVSLEDEYELKKEAVRRGLMLMGPDCGTAIIAGVPLGFANAVRRGSVGVVGASGTGMQEITSLIDRYGGGISHAIGTGSRDLSERIGGEMTAVGLRALLDDEGTSTIVLVSKPPPGGRAEGAGHPRTHEQDRGRDFPRHSDTGASAGRATGQGVAGRYAGRCRAASGRKPGYGDP
jgi:succinyl-CoA synthetase alpha subunit